MIVTGLEKFLQQTELYRGRRAALIVNHTSVTSGFEYSWDVLRDRIDLRRLFSPEHGLFGTEQDQIPVTRPPGVPFEVVSLYGSSAGTLIPDRSCIADLDLVIFDIQDIGTRYYTFVNTMVLFMKAISGSDIEFVVLDRPNPIGGELAEGPLIRDGFTSFVGIMPVPPRHGFTAGELALLARDYFHLDVNLNIVSCDGWRRHETFAGCGATWIAPSPNMPDIETALVYPGTCLFEGLNVSEGRGTTAPFKMIGAPFVRPFEFAAQMNGLGLPGVRFRPVYFRPTFSKYTGEEAGGVYVHVTDAASFRPFLTGVALTKTLHDAYPEFRFLNVTYEFNSEHPAFDLLTGSALIREMIQSGNSLEEIESGWRAEERTFRENKSRYHLY